MSYPLATPTSRGSVPVVPCLRRRFLVRKDVAGILGGGWIDGDVPFVDVLNDPVFVDHKGRTIAIAAVFIEDAIVLDHCAFEIAEQRKGDAVLLAEFSVRGNTVHTDAENLRVGSFEFGDISLIRLHFLRSTTGEG